MLISCFNFSVLLLIVILNVLDVSSVCTRRAAADADDNDDNDNDDDDDGDDGGSLQVISRVCVPTFTSNVDCEPTSWRRTCRVFSSFCCHGCRSGLTWSRRRHEPHSASWLSWPSRRRAAVCCAVCQLDRSRRRSTSGWRRVLSSCSARSSSTRSSTRSLAVRRRSRPVRVRPSPAYYRPPPPPLYPYSRQPPPVLRWRLETKLNGWEDYYLSSISTVTSSIWMGSEFPVSGDVDWCTVYAAINILRFCDDDKLMTVKTSVKTSNADVDGTTAISYLPVLPT